MKAVLLTKPGCTPCEAMRQVLLEAEGEFCLDVEERDVTADPELAQFEMSVPLLLLGEQPTFRFFVTREALTRVLEEKGCPRRWSSPVGP